MQRTMVAGGLWTSDNQAPRIVDGLSARQPNLGAYKADPRVTWTTRDGVLQG